MSEKDRVVETQQRLIDGEVRATEHEMQRLSWDERAPTVLLVEDNRGDQVITKVLLEHLGCSVLTAEDALSGVRVAIQHHPDLILLDIVLPGRDGFEAMGILKSRPDTREIPIVVVSSLPPELIRKRCEEAGCDQILGKAVTRATLLNMLRRFGGRPVDPSEN